jgi:hypothetical protein
MTVSQMATTMAAMNKITFTISRASHVCFTARRAEKTGFHVANRNVGLYSKTAPLQARSVFSFRSRRKIPALLFLFCRKHREETSTSLLAGCGQ